MQHDPGDGDGLSLDLINLERAHALALLLALALGLAILLQSPLELGAGVLVLVEAGPHGRVNQLAAAPWAQIAGRHLPGCRCHSAVLLLAFQLVDLDFLAYAALGLLRLIPALYDRLALLPGRRQ